MGRTQGGYDPNNVNSNGDPNTPYYRLHVSDESCTFGTLHTHRDANDLPGTQVSSGYFAAFEKTGNANPPTSYLELRGYIGVLRGN